MTDPVVPPDLAKLGESDEFLLSVAGQVREHIAAITQVDGAELTVDQVRPLINTLSAAMFAAVGGPPLLTRLISPGGQIAVRVAERGQREWKIMNADGSIEYNSEMVLPGAWAQVTP